MYNLLPSSSPSQNISCLCSCFACPRILFNFWRLTQSLAWHPLNLSFFSGKICRSCSVIVFSYINTSVESYLRFHLNMQECCSQGLKAHFKRFRGKNVDVFTHVVLLFLCVADLAQGLGRSAARRRQKLQSKLLWSGADFTETSRWRGDELCASWRFSENWEVTLCRYKDDLSHAEMCRISADELPVYAPHRAHAIRRREQEITDGDVHKIPSFSSCTWVNRGGVHVTPAFPFYTLINVTLSSKCDCSRCFSALIAAFSRLSGRDLSHNK